MSIVLVALAATISCLTYLALICARREDKDIGDIMRRLKKLETKKED